MTSFSSSIELLSSFMGFFLSIHFFTFKKQLSFFLLGTFLFVFSYEIALVLLEPHYVYSPFLAFGNALLYIPLLFLYILSLNTSPFKLTFGRVALFIPWLLDSLCKVYWWVQPFLSQDQRLEFHFFQSYHFITGVLAYGFAILLLIVSMKHLRKLPGHFSKKVKVWLMRLVTILLVFNWIWLFEDLANLFAPGNWFSSSIPELSSFFTLITVCWIGLNALRPSFFLEKTMEKKQAIENKIKPTGYQALNSQQLLIYDQLENLLKTKKIYARLDLTLGTLADELGVTDKFLSKVIYTKTGLRYYDFINQWRIEAFKVLLQSEIAQRLSIEGIAKEVGFKSKSTFYAYFKKMELITPKQYQQKFL